MTLELHSSFDTLTLAGIEQLKTLHDILADELTALTDRDLVKIKACAIIKVQVLTNFSENSQHRTALLKSQNCSSDKAGISFFFAKCADSKAKSVYLQHWTQLEETLCAAIDANNINEQVLKRNQKNLDTILAILQGQQTHNVLYDAKGDKGDYTGQSRIGKA
jgi:flagellar biosynthesis/type III secretory pathway chaperone